MRRRPKSYEVAARLYLDGLLTSGLAAVPCSLCGAMVDLEHRGRDSMSRSVEHTIPIARGGAMLDAAGWRVAHYGCNSRKGDKLKPKRLPDAPLSTSREW
jgi:hypothetical protein